jgi:hypothetical protein
VLKYPGPVNWFLRRPPNDVGFAKPMVEEPPKLGVVVAALPQWWVTAGLATSASLLAGAASATSKEQDALTVEFTTMLSLYLKSIFD